MEVNIYKQNGTVRAVVEPADSAAANEELMADTVLTLSFTHYDYIRLMVNDYVDFLGKRYWLLKNYRPVKKSSIEYQYDVKFYGIESKLKKALVLKLVDGDNSTAFSLNDSPAVHLQLFIDNMNRITGSDVWCIGQVVDSANVNIEYDCISCFDGLGKLAEAVKTEWWVEGYTLNLCRCEHGDMLELGYGKGLLNVSKDSNDNAPFFTRLYPIGNTRNIDPKVYGSTRLHLPGGAQYVEQNVDLGIVEYSEESAFKDIYPRRVGQVGVVRHEPRTIEGEEREIYFFTDPGLTFNPDDYEIGGLVKMVKFQAGELNGQDFEVNWHNDTKEFEIINQYPYENQQLPGGKLVPKTGNDYVLYNIRMPEEYYRLAEEELAAAVAEFLKTYSIDTAVYKAPTDYIYFTEKEINLKLGRRVRLYSEYFDNGYQDSRVVSINRKLNIPCSMDIGCSMAVSSTKLSKMENNITEIQAAFKEQLNKDVLQVLKSWDSADPSEYNVFSSLRSLKEIAKNAISKKLNDTAAGIITFLSGIRIGKFVTGMIGGSGAAITVDKYGKTKLEIDKIEAREELIVPKITFNCIDVISGDKANTFSFGTIKSVDKDNLTAELDLLDGQTGTPHPGDILRGVFHNLDGGNPTEDTYDDNGYLNYSGFSTSYFTPTEIIESKPGVMSFRYALQSGTTVHPMKGMNFYAYGNFTDKSRQAITYENRHYTRILKDVNTWVINPDKHIAMQDGLLEGLTIRGMVMHGHGTFMENCYIIGAYIQFTPEQKEELAGQSAYSVNLSTHESVIVIDEENNIIGGYVDEKHVTSQDSCVTAEDKHVTTLMARIKTRVQAFKGAKELYYSDTYHEDAYLVSLNPVGCKATIDNGIVIVTEITDFENAYVDISVNCEGNTVFDKQFKVTAVRNGASTLTSDLDNGMDSLACDPQGTVLSGLPFTTTAHIWYGAAELAVDKIELELPAGVTGTVNTNHITITGISKEASPNINIGVTVFGTHAGTQYRKRTPLVLNKLLPGSNGETPVIYNIQPSANSVKVDKSGNFDIEEITCNLMRTEGSAIEESILPEGHTMNYMIDDKAPVSYTPGDKVIATHIDKKISFKLYKGETLVDMETIPVMRDGTDGKDGLSSIYSNLTNSNTSVPCDENGNVIGGLPVTTKVTMSYGNEDLPLDEITVSAPEGITHAINKEHKEISITAITRSVGLSTNVDIHMKATRDGFQYTRTEVMSINKILKGADGKDPVIHELLPSASSISVTGDNGFTPDKLSCQLKETKGETSAVVSSIPEGYAIEYSVDDSTVRQAYTYGSAIQVTSGITKSLTFHFIKREGGAGRTLDQQRIPLVRDGKPGADGSSTIYSTIDNANASVGCDEHGNVLSNLPIELKVRMFYGTEELRLDSIEISAPSGIGYTSTVGENKVQITGVTKDVPVVSNVAVKMKATHKSVQYTREEILTINKILKGADGKAPVIHELLPSASSIKVDKNGAYSPVKLSCLVKRTTGTTIETPPSLPSGLELCYSMDDTTQTLPYPYGTEMDITTGFTNSITFILKNGNPSHTIDSQRIPIMRDGANGEPGKPGVYTEFRYKYSNSKPATPTWDNLAGWSLSPERDEINFSHSGDMGIAPDLYHATPFPSNDSLTYTQRISFTTAKDNQTFFLSVYVGSGYPFRTGIVMRPDVPHSENAAPGDTLWTGSWTTDALLEIPVRSQGQHFVDIAYRSGRSENNRDYMRYRVTPQRVCWLSTRVVDSSLDTPSPFSVPVEFHADKPDKEHIYLLSKRKIEVDMPASDLYLDKHIPDANAYEIGKNYRVGNTVKYNGAYKVCVKPTVGNAPSNPTCWDDIKWWTGNPSGAGEEYPHEYTCSREMRDGRWDKYQNYRLFMGHSESYALIPSVTQIGQSMTGSYEPGSFTVRHKDSEGNPVNTYIVVWGSDNGSSWNKVGGYDRVSSVTVDVTRYPYKYYVIRSYSAASATWDGDYLLSVSVSVVADGKAGASGAMPVYCGIYSPGVEYTYTNTTRDIINHKIDGGIFTFQVRVHGSVVTTPPTSSTGDAHWEPASKMKFVAMDTALIDGANIAGFMYKNLRMMSRLGVLDGKETDIKDVPDSRFKDFVPHIMMDGNTGDAEWNKIKVRGSVSEPFEAYSSVEDLRNGISMSWIINNHDALNNSALNFSDKRFNGQTLRIYNNSGNVWADMTFFMRITPSGGMSNVLLPTDTLLTAIGWLNPSTGYVSWYLTCPYTRDPSSVIYKIQNYSK